MFVAREGTLNMSKRLLALSAITCAVVSGCYGPGMRGPGYGYGYPQNGYFSGAPYGQPQYIGQPYPGSYTAPGRWSCATARRFDVHATRVFYNHRGRFIDAR